MITLDGTDYTNTDDIPQFWGYFDQNCEKLLFKAETILSISPV